MALVGALIFTSAYHLYRYVLDDGVTYQVTNMLYIDYADGVEETEWINQYTWSELADCDAIVDVTYVNLSEAYTKEYIKDHTNATIEADVRYLYTYTETNDPEESMLISDAFYKALVDFGAGHEDIESIEIATSGAPYDNSDIRTVRALIAGAVLGLIIYVIIWLWAAIADTSVYLPVTLEKRYHIATLGALSMDEYDENCKYMLNGLHNIALVQLDKEAVIPMDLIRGNCKTEIVKNPVYFPGEAEKIRQMDACILCVEAGAHNGKKIERTLEQLARQDITVRAMVLINEDAYLIEKYYRK